MDGPAPFVQYPNPKIYDDKNIENKKKTSKMLSDTVSHAIIIITYINGEKMISELKNFSTDLTAVVTWWMHEYIISFS